MKTAIKTILLLAIGLSAGYFGQELIKKQINSLTGNTETAERKILYWIAPMDKNYRSNKPGKSPMGMDLIPVYEKEKAKPKEREILYWYAPMDKNYHSNKPGKSPMGMDLLPFYKEENESNKEGVIKISPTVQNNLGVRFGKVVKGDFEKNIRTVGYITLDENKLHQVHTRVKGWVERLYVKETGALVKKGQKLFEIYSPLLVSAQEELVSVLSSNNQYLIDASKAKLLSLGVSNKEIKKLLKTKKVKQRVGYFAPHNGFIEKLNIRQGTYVKPATNVISIASLDTVWVIAEIFESQSSYVKEGQKVTMTTSSYPNKTWQGDVDYIYPILDKNTRTLQVRIRFNNQGYLLKPNMFTRLTIKDRFDEDSLFVKREAVIRTGTMEKVVKSLGKGQFLSVAVKTGFESGQYIQILQGLKEGDTIVTSAHFLIDSESSLTASFERMQYDDNNETSIDNQVWVKAKVVSINRKKRLLNLDHEAIEAWKKPAMFMDIKAKENVNLNVEESQRYLFLFEYLPNGTTVVADIKKEHEND